MKRKIKILPLIFHGVGMAAVIAALIVGNNLVKEFELAITTELCPGIVDKTEITQSGVSGQEMSTLIMEEGAVLLKNENNTLPLSKATTPKVNVFGWKSIEWAYGNVGSSASGCVRPEDGDGSKNVDLLKALTNYGIEYNTQLQEMYKTYQAPLDLANNPTSSNVANMVRLVEPSISDKSFYSDTILNNAKEYSDTALVVISRLAGENWNCFTDRQVKNTGTVYDRHHLEISTEEEELLTYVGANYENVIVILNAGNVLELGFLDTIPGLDACLFVGYTGTRAATAIPGLLYGEASPSGHLVDTYAYDLFTNPANIFTNPLKYSNYSSNNYLDLIENIYIGYKWYETADTMGYWDQYGGYDKIVQFPFGYGLSYTTFDWEITNFSKAPGSSFTKDDKIAIEITVTNTGDVAGKDVVAIYANPPYYTGEIEKSSVNLVSFAKTHLIEPDKNEVVNLEIDPYDFASYDCYDKNNNGHKGYELDAGDYVFSFRTDAHTVKEVIYDDNRIEGNFTYTIDEIENYSVDPVTGQPVGNLFTGEDAIDKVPLDAKESSFDPNIPWLNRSSFPTLEQIESYYTPREAGPNAQFSSISSATREARLDEWDNATEDAFGEPTDLTATEWGKDNGLSLTKNGVLTDLGKKLGEDFDDPDWDKLLEQLSKADVYNLINNYYGTKAVSSIGKPQLLDFDGPAQIKGFRGTPRGVGFPIMTVCASTWNLRLAYDFGKAYGDSTVSVGVNGMWGWAIDNHRSSFFGRANESPSEDPVLAGKFVARAVKGYNTRGRYCFLKHFSYYVTGWNHNSWGKLCTNIYNTEQGFRETTLKAFRYAFVDGGALGCMTSYEGIGAEHAETTEALLVGVLRKEWDFKGAITTDYISNYPSSDEKNALQIFIRNGGNLGMAVSLPTSDDFTSPRAANRLKDVAKEILWTWLRAEYNGRYYAANPDADDTYTHTTTIASWVWWKPIVYSLNTTVIIGLVFWAEMVVMNRVFPKKKKEEVTDSSDKGGKK